MGNHGSRSLALSLVLALAGCDGSAGGSLRADVSSDSGAQDAGSPDSEAPDAAALDAMAPDVTSADVVAPDAAPWPGLVAHEWGMLTSVQSSVGTDLEGVHHPEEELPGFVPVRSFGGPGSGAAELLPAGVTHRVQGLVTYLYADGPPPESLTLRSLLPLGVPQSAWPDGELEPAVGDVASLEGGAVSWHLTVSDQTPPDTDDPVWQAMRDVPALTVEAGAAERFVFRQGLARLSLPLRVESTEDGRFRVINAAPETIPFAWLVHVHEGGGLILDVGALAPGEETLKSPTPKELDPDIYTTESSGRVAEQLVAQGLTAPEADALVATWADTVFRTPGLRLLYVAPRAWLDEALPVTIDPAPEELVRVVVGRVEVLSRDEEQQLGAELMTPAGGAALLERLGAFAEPKLRRVRDLLEDPGAQAACDALLEQAVKID